MKYLLQDTLTGNYVQSSGKGFMEVTSDIYRAALFDNEVNATKAIKKQLNRDGTPKSCQYRHIQFDTPKPCTYYFTTQEAKDKVVEQWIAREGIDYKFTQEMMNVKVQTYHLEVKEVEFKIK